MRACEAFNLSFGEKVYGIEVFNDSSTDLIAVGLKNSIVIYQITFDEAEDKFRHNVIQAINHDSIVHSMAWSPETKVSVAPRFLQLATSSLDHNVRIFSTDLSGNNDTLRILKGHRDYVNTMAFHPREEGGQIVTGSDDHTLALWDTQTGKKLQLITFDHPVMSVMWHPEEISKLMIAEKNGVIHIFNIASYKPILSLHCGAEPLLTADWSVSNSLLISAAVRSEIMFFDLSKMAAVTKKKTSSDIIKSIKLSPFSDHLVAIASQPDFNVQVANMRSNQTITILQKEPISGIAWFKKKPLLVIGNNERVIAFQLLNKQN